ncbi:hypothetical protein Hanom_Chr09g00780601 [Helianthus anomalus]
MFDEGNIVEGLYLPTIAWDFRMSDITYMPSKKIAESTLLIHPTMVNHWVDHAFLPVEVSYVEGQDYGQLLDVTMTDTVSRLKRISEIKRC